MVTVEIEMERGFFTYFVEDWGVFEEARGRSLPLLLKLDEQDHGEEPAAG